MDPILAGAFIDDSSSPTHSNSRIFGVRLRKFSLWHRLLLNAVDSPFVNRGDVYMVDIRIAIGICRCKPFDSRIRKPWILPAALYAWLALSALWPRKLKRRYKGPHPDRNAIWRAVQKQADAFLKYVGDYIQEPEYVVVPRPKGKNQPPDTSRGRFDDAIEHAGELIQWGIPEERAWGMPIGQARIYRIMARRHAGMDIDIMDEHEREFREQMRKKFREG